VDELKRYYLHAQRPRHPWWKAARAAAATIPDFARGLVEWRRIDDAPIINADLRETMAFWDWARALPGWTDNSGGPVGYLDRQDPNFIQGTSAFNRDSFDAAYLKAMDSLLSPKALWQMGVALLVSPVPDGGWLAEIDNADPALPTSCAATPDGAVQALMLAIGADVRQHGRQFDTGPEAPKGL
jgi:hypothetical protein